MSSDCGRFWIPLNSTLLKFLASADDNYGWSYGEVKKPETINYRTLKPEKGWSFLARRSLTCKDWECAQAQGIRQGHYLRALRCVEVTNVSVVTAYYIELAAPVSHICVILQEPNQLPPGTSSDIKSKDLEKVLYFCILRNHQC